MSQAESVDSRPSKRSRTASTQITEHRCSSLYFSDGNIVLRAAGLVDNEDESGNEAEADQSSSDDADSFTFFRVHKSILSLHSPVFRDMFASAQPTKASDIETPLYVYDGVEFIHVHDVADELRDFPSVLYDPYFFPSSQFDEGYFHRMLGPLVLANKYKVTSLRKEIISRIRSAWPINLSDWKKREEAYAQVDTVPLEAEDAIRLVLDGGIQDEVPAELAMMYYEHYQQCDAESPHSNVLFHAQRRINEMLVSWERPDLKCSEEAKDCGRRKIYEKFILAFLRTYEPLNFFSLRLDALTPKFSGEITLFGVKICGHCASKLAGYFEKLQVEFMESIPKLFSGPETSSDTKAD
ncbi:hypothetical protein HGRIS_011868 [Hohenbuehelia grisea]|uniref:BTB domain-containing protein n=1 Tax=Hohenbuehelia grisea TaxID=104357 RepID=A0ABR3JYG6_9AGAR